MRPVVVELRIYRDKTIFNRLIFDLLLFASFVVKWGKQKGGRTGRKCNKLSKQNIVFSFIDCFFFVTLFVLSASGQGKTSYF